MFRDGAEQLLVFQVGAERFAVALAAVDEAIEVPPLRPLPDAGATVLGVATGCAGPASGARSTLSVPATGPGAAAARTALGWPGTASGAPRSAAATPRTAG